jgi:hypothetical protein
MLRLPDDKKRCLRVRSASLKKRPKGRPIFVKAGAGIFPRVQKLPGDACLLKIQCTLNPNSVYTEPQNSVHQVPVRCTPSASLVYTKSTFGVHRFSAWCTLIFCGQGLSRNSDAGKARGAGCRGRPRGGLARARPESCRREARSGVPARNRRDARQGAQERGEKTFAALDSRLVSCYSPSTFFLADGLVHVRPGRPGLNLSRDFWRDG